MNSNNLETLDDKQLDMLNDLLPWASYTLDSRGRRFGKAYSEIKRAEAQEIPDARIVFLNDQLTLKNKKVLELGCFEGLHTVALAQFSDNVLSLDSRIENIAKTAVRCALYGVTAKFLCRDLEDGFISDAEFDVLVHMGVLYHLSDPVKHLTEISPFISTSLLLDTHVASPDSISDVYSVGGIDYPFYSFDEGGLQVPFAGMKSSAKWLLKVDLLRLLVSLGFNIVKQEERVERNGLRLFVYAEK